MMFKQKLDMQQIEIEDSINTPIISYDYMIKKYEKLERKIKLKLDMMDRFKKLQEELNETKKKKS